MSDASPAVGETSEKVVARMEKTVKEAKALVKTVKAKAAKTAAKKPTLKSDRASSPVATKGASAVKVATPKGNQKGKKVIEKIRKPGPAMKKLASKIKVQYTLGECRLRGCTEKATTKRAKWCKKHKKEIRKAQLRENNVVWHQRVQKGTAGHHVVYAAKPTAWTLANKEKALRMVKRGNSILPTIKAFKEVLRKAPTTKATSNG